MDKAAGTTYFFLSMFFLYMFICVVYLHAYKWEGKYVRDTHVYVPMCIGRAELSFGVSLSCIPSYVLSPYV